MFGDGMSGRRIEVSGGELPSKVMLGRSQGPHSTAGRGNH